MEPRLSIVTLGVADLARAVRFYRDGLGFPLSSASNDDIAFFRTGGVVLALFGREALAEDAHVPAAGSGFEGFTIAHNVRSKEEVDRVFALAVAAGATPRREPGDVFWGGYTSYVADPDGHLWEIAWNPFSPLDEAGAVTLPE